MGVCHSRVREAQRKWRVKPMEDKDFGVTDGTVKVVDRNVKVTDRLAKVVDRNIKATDKIARTTARII